MKRQIVLVVLMIWLNGITVAGTRMDCEYQFHESKPPTRLYFSLPDEISFGKLVPIQIKTDSGATSAMNTVILKDYPYIMLADVYRIENDKSKVILVRISPEKTRIELAFVNMGDQANAKFFKGACSTAKDMK